MDVVFSRNTIQYDKNTVVTVGTFDGVHEGHREILREVVRRATARGGRSVVVTFEPHPREVVGTAAVQLLTTLDERQRLIDEVGPDILFVIPFTYEFSRQSFREFYLTYFIEGIGVSEIVEGYDHHFGRDREGNIEELLKLGKEFELSIVVVKPYTVDGEVVSSSKIRQHLIDGNVERARVLLGRPYSVTGTVVRGEGRGARLGYPTANIALASAKKIVPRDGIYFVGVRVDQKFHPGMASIGVRPTFSSNGQRTVEVNILEYRGDLYGQSIELHFLKRLRDEQKFDSAEALVAQMDRDRVESLKLRQEYALLFH
jgi:riboflavin kinase/FMN adenylyltransferase